MKTKSGILDTFQETLNPKLWSSVNDEPVMDPDFRSIVQNAYLPFINKYGFTLNGMLFYGGNAGYQYHEGSDADFSVYIQWPEDKKVDYDNLADELNEAKFDYKGIECHFFLKPPTETELVEANENVYNVTKNEWVQKPEKHDFDPKEQFADQIVKAELLREKMQAQFDVIYDEIKEMQKLGVDEIPKDTLKAFEPLISIVAKLRNNRNIEHAKMREKAVDGQRITFFDRATQNEIAWKTISETPMLKKLDEIKRLLK